MTPRQEAIYKRAWAHAKCGWTAEYLQQFRGEDFYVAMRGYNSGRSQRAREQAKLEEQNRLPPIYSGRQT